MEAIEIAAVAVVAAAAAAVAVVVAAAVEVELNQINILELKLSKHYRVERQNNPVMKKTIRREHT